MSREKILHLFSALLCTALLAGCGEPEQVDPELAQEAPSQDSYRDFGAYRIHFNALSTDNLAPEVARAYNITRSKNRAMLNVSIIRHEEAGTGSPVKGKVTVKAANLTGQLKSMKLREIAEGDGASGGIYYLGEVPVADGETLIFDISVRPTGESASYQVRFQKQFFTD